MVIYKLYKHTFLIIYEFMYPALKRTIISECYNQLAKMHDYFLYLKNTTWGQV